MRVMGAEQLLVGSLAVVLTGFVAESGYMFYRDGLVQREADRSGASVQARAQHIQAMRKSILDLSLCPLTIARTRADTIDCMISARDRLDAELIALERMETFPGRAEALSYVRRELETLDARLKQLKEAPAEGPRNDAAVVDVLQTLEPLNHAFDRLAVAGVHQTLRRTSEVGAVMRRSEISELLVGGTAFLIAALALLFGVRAMRRHERALATKADELERFAGTVAHDLLSPLASLGVSMPVIQERYPDDEQMQRLTKRALSSVKRVRALVEELLDFARSGATPTGARVAPATVVADVISELSEQVRAARAEVSIDEMVDGSVSCSAGVLYSIVSNLVMNALKYLGDAAERRVRVRVSARGAFVHFEVEDTGPGVHPALASTIFEPYVRGRDTRQAGFGLGLATVKRLVCAHGGDVGFSSSPDGGAIFWFDVPRGRVDERRARHVQIEGNAN